MRKLSWIWFRKVANIQFQLHTMFINTQANCKVNPNLEFYNRLAKYTAGLVHKPPADKLEDVSIFGS